MSQLTWGHTCSTEQKGMSILMESLPHSWSSSFADDSLLDLSRSNIEKTSAGKYFSFGFFSLSWLWVSDIKQIVFTLLFVHVTGSYHPCQRYLHRYRVCLSLCVYIRGTSSHIRMNGLQGFVKVHCEKIIWCVWNSRPNSNVDMKSICNFWKVWL